MGKGGAVLGIIGIIVGAGGFGFGVLAWNSATSNNTKLTELENDLINQVNSTLNLFNTTLIGLTSEDNWYNYRDSEFTPSPAVDLFIYYLLVALDVLVILRVFLIFFSIS
ncbi:MAG: hypothetical protein ACW972_02150 [Promethearchaeota archaeon]|jgi:hypothetical protein